MLKSMGKSKIRDSTPCKIVTHEDFNLKLGTRDYVGDSTHRATLGSNRPSGGFPPKSGKYNPDVTFLVILFFSRSRAQVERSHRFVRWMAQMTWFRPRKCLLGVRTMGDVIWEKYSPKTPQKSVNRQFQAKTPKSLHRNIFGTINPTN